MLHKKINVNDLNLPVHRFPTCQAETLKWPQPMQLSGPLLIQEVFHVYLNKFENAVTHLFLAILGNN